MDAVEKLLKSLTLEEKAKLCVGKSFWEIEGVPRLGINAINVSDGPHGLRKQFDGNDHLGIHSSQPATCFPTASLLGATWNPELIYEMGVALGKECIDQNVQILLGPGINMKRSPLCGRNFEYFSEDPHLTSELAVAWCKGVQSQNVGTSLKHFAVNNQETRRMIVNAVVDERALREVYLKSFESVIKRAEPDTVMCAYNRLNGHYCSENEWLLNEILRKDWGFKGTLITDWGATNDRVLGLINGQDVEMPGATDESYKLILSAVENKILSVEVLDRAALRILTLLLKFQGNQQIKADLNTSAIYKEHHDLAKKIASEGIVLLKNDGILPLSKRQRIGVLGEFVEHPRYQGSGSSLIVPTKLNHALYCMVQKNENPDLINHHIGFKSDLSNLDEADKIKKICQSSDVVCLFVGLPEAYESEGFDRDTLRLPEHHLKLIEEVKKHSTKVVVCLSNGAPIAMPWKDDVSAIVEGYLGGQAGYEAMVDILFGDVNPSGKLAETFPAESNVNFGDEKNVIYKESIYIGYRFYDRFKGKVEYPFGHGLSYTTFDVYDAIYREENEMLSVRVGNLGHRDGRTVVQVYLEAPLGQTHRAKKILIAFEKVHLKHGESQLLSLKVPKESFKIYDTGLKAWYLAPGEYKLLIGFSSEDLPLCLPLMVREDQIINGQLSNEQQANEQLANVQLTSIKKVEVKVTALDQLYISNYEGIFSISENAYLNAALLERDTSKSIDLNTPINELKHTFIGWILMKLIYLVTWQQSKKQSNEGMKKMIISVRKEITLRNLTMMSNGFIKNKVGYGLLEMLRGNYIKGLKIMYKKNNEVNTCNRNNS